MQNADYFERQVWAAGLSVGPLLYWYAYLAVPTSIRSEFGIRCKGPVLNPGISAFVGGLQAADARTVLS